MKKEALKPDARLRLRLLDTGAGGLCPIASSDPQSDRPGAAWAALWLLAAIDGDNECHP